MTNWATLFLPKATLPDVDLGALGGEKPLTVMFRPHFNKYSVAELCHPHHPDILENQARRWRDSFSAIRSGSTYFDRPQYQPPLAHEFYYRPTTTRDTLLRVHALPREWDPIHRKAGGLDRLPCTGHGHRPQGG
eukprot:scaffold18299_cov117-Isochrysis_galbana.AAC.1